MRRATKQTDLFNDVFQLHNGHTHEAVISCEAIVLDAYVKFKRFQTLFVADDTVRPNKSPI